MSTDRPDVAAAASSAASSLRPAARSYVPASIEHRVVEPTASPISSTIAGMASSEG